MGKPQERKFRRFKLQYLVQVRFPSGSAMAEIDAVTRNISVGGLLLESGCLIPYRSSVEFTITVEGGSISRPVKLTGAGKVVRVEAGEMADGFGIAVACSESLTTQVNDLTAGVPVL